jgi:hypothetical protein
MSNVITELKALWKIIKLFASVFAGIAFGWFCIVGLWAIFGN